MKSESKIASFFNALFVDFRQLGIIGKIERVVEKMNPSEKILFSVISFVAIITGLILLIQVSNSFLVEVPTFGGSFTEGMVGSPRFINPILALSDTDKDVSALVYSGLLKMSTESEFVNDLAESYEIKETGRVYEFTIKDTAYFHDGKKVTTDDVIFTVNKILDPTIKSPRYANWAGVLVEKIDERQVRFTLEKPYAPFLEALTVGILPKHIWEKASSEEFPFSEFNINPIGSGPYSIKKVNRNGGGILNSVTLASFHNYTLGRPKIDSIVLKFFQNENELYRAYQNGSIESASGLSSKNATNIKEEVLIENVSLPRVFGVFINQNIAPVFLNKEIREALDLSAPRQRIVDEVLFGFGQVLNGPTPSSIEKNPEIAVGNIEKAKEILSASGWTPNENGILEKKTKAGTTLFSFSLSTSDAPELKSAANILKEAWEQLGAQVDIKVFEAGDLSQNIIKGRKYDTLLFGEVVGDNSDLYPFWHSSARNDPGLNVALYANITVDKALEEIRGGVGKEDYVAKKEIIISEIKKDIPTIFLFSPKLIYIQSKKVNNILLKNVSSQNERFLTVNDWFIETDKVWKIFVAQEIE